MLRWLLVGLTGGAVLAACGAKEPEGEYTGPLMRPGQDCLSCHSDGAGRGAPTWSAGGTVYAKAEAAADEGLAGVDVLLSAPDGTLLEKLVTNSAGNFYTPKPLPVGFTVALEYQGQHIDMPCPPPAGLCNVCHNNPPLGGAPGRIYIPQAADPNRPPFSCGNFEPQMPGGAGAAGANSTAGAAGAASTAGAAGMAGSAPSELPASGGSGSGELPGAAKCTGSATYDVNVNVTWSDASVASRHFTTLIGGVHTPSLSLWQPGGMATPGIQAMAESGNVATLSGEVQAAITAGTALSIVKFGGGSAPGASTTQVTVEPDFPSLSFGSMLAPTPDLFLGLSGLNLCEAGTWLTSKTIDAIVYDAGTKNGTGFNYGEGPTDPHAAIAKAAEFTAPAGTITLSKR